MVWRSRGLRNETWNSNLKSISVTPGYQFQIKDKNTKH